MSQPQFKIVDSDFEVEFEILESTSSSNEFNRSSKSSTKNDHTRVNSQIQENDQRIDEFNREIDRLTNHADGPDYIAAVFSGLFAGIIDILWVGEFDFNGGKAWSNKTVNEFVMDVAKSKGYEGKRLDGAIRYLENNFKIPSDSIWKGKDLGISARSHHLDDLAHHPTLIGLFASILTQFTRESYFQNSEGSSFSIRIDESNHDLIGSDFLTKIFCGTVNWFFHLVSDMSGSNKTAGVGMGIPGPVVSMLKEISLIPGLNKSSLAKKLKEVYTVEKFDLRSELAVAHEIGRQAVPVLINEVFVRVFYFIRRLMREYQQKKSFALIEWKNTLPWKNRTIVRMLTIATGTFTLVDVIDASVRAGIKSGGDPTLFATQFLLRVNFVGVGRFVFAVGTDLSMGMKRERLRNDRIKVMSNQLHLMNSKSFYLLADTWVIAGTTDESINDLQKSMTKTLDFFDYNWKQNKGSLKRISERNERVILSNPDLNSDIIDILTGDD